jgi:hypothetical protein
MIPIRFYDLDSKQRASSSLAGRYYVKSLKMGELLVPAAAVADLAAEGFDFQVLGSSAQQGVRGPIMLGESPPSGPASSCLVRIHPGPDGQFTAHLLGAPDLSATAATLEDAVEQLRVLLQQQVNLDSLVAIEIPRQNPLLKLAGAWKDDPSFDDFLEEIRKFREEEDCREGYVSDTGQRPTPAGCGLGESGPSSPG